MYKRELGCSYFIYLRKEMSFLDASSLYKSLTDWPNKVTLRMSRHQDQKTLKQSQQPLSRESANFPSHILYCFVTLPLKGRAYHNCDTVVLIGVWEEGYSRQLEDPVHCAGQGALLREGHWLEKEASKGNHSDIFYKMQLSRKLEFVVKVQEE